MKKLPQLLTQETKMIGVGPLHARHLLYELANGAMKRYTAITRHPEAPLEGNAERPDGVNMLIFDQDGERVLLEREFRLGVNAFVYNLPQGLVDEGETPILAAERELREEAGITKLDFICEYPLLPTTYTAPAMTNQTEQLLIGQARDFDPASATPSASETIELLWATKYEALDLLQQTDVKFTSKTQALLYGWVWGADFLHSF